ncbi:MAG: hypothetical protein AAF430_05015 [Myxococcota bacterium]
MQRDITPPSATGLLREAEAAFEFPRLAFRLPGLLQGPRGDGGTVLVLPGYGAGDASTLTLRGYLRWLGHRPVGWELGTNRGDVPALLPEVVERLRACHRDAGEPISLVGWSLGGYLAREAARDEPELVRQVITLGSPVVGGPKYTTVGALYARQGVDLDEVEAEVDARYDTPLQRPVTAIYSKRDGVVAWQACIDERSPRVEHVEVNATHVGLGFSADVFSVVAERLASPPTAD